MKCNFNSTPSGAEITVDWRYVGSTPSEIGLSPGTHVVVISLPGFAEWKRDLTVGADSAVNVTANLQKTQPCRARRSSAGIPRARRIRSWVFDSSGGFGEYVWVQEGHRWLMQYAGSLGDGSEVSATYVLSMVDPQHLHTSAERQNRQRGAATRGRRDRRKAPGHGQGRTQERSAMSTSCPSTPTDLK